MAAAEVICARLFKGRPRGRRALVAAHTGSIAHSGRALLIAEALGSLGVDVVKAGDCSQPYAQKVLGVDPRFHAPLLSQERIYDYAQQRVSWGFYNRKTLLEHVLKWRELIRSGNFDVVVVDFAHPAIIAADSLGIPSVSVQNALWTSAFRFRLTPPENHWLHRWFARLGLAWYSRFASRYFGSTNHMYALYQYLWSLPYSHVRRKLGLEGRSSFAAHAEGTLVLVPDFESVWQRCGPPQSSKYVVVGPVTWEPGLGHSDESFRIRELLDCGRRFVYATLGSSGTKEIFSQLLEAFARRTDGLVLVLTTGNQFAGWQGWEQAPDNVVMEPFFPGSLALSAPGCVAAINHGGSGSAYQALLSAPGKPLIMIPTHADQQWNAQILQELGLGVLLLQGDLTPDRLNALLDRLLLAALAT